MKDSIGMWRQNASNAVIYYHDEHGTLLRIHLAAKAPIQFLWCAREISAIGKTKHRDVEIWGRHHKFSFTN